MFTSFKWCLRYLTQWQTLIHLACSIADRNLTKEHLYHKGKKSQSNNSRGIALSFPEVTESHHRPDFLTALNPQACSAAASRGQLLAWRASLTFWICTECPESLSSKLLYLGSSLEYCSYLTFVGNRLRISENLPICSAIIRLKAFKADS